MIKRQVAFATLVMGLMVGFYGATAEAGAQVGYKVGKGLSVASDDGNNKIGISGRVQVRHTYTGAENGVADSNSFAIQRAKLKMKGHVLNPNLKYGFQMAFGTKSGTSTTTIGTTTVVTKETQTGLAVLEDAYADWTPFKFFGIKAGQFKVPYLKQELTSSGSQQFVDRSVSTGDYDFKRDLGLTFHGSLNPHFRYDVFFMNGAGMNNLNGNQALLMGLRFEVPIMGKYASSESDVGYSESPDIGVGLAYAFTNHDSAFSGSTVGAGIKASHGTLDFGIKYRGFSAQLAAMLIRTHEGGRFTNYGYNAQVGYFVIPKKFELALRAASTIFNGAVVNEHEYALALNYFIKGHAIKLQTDYAVLMNNGGTLNQDDHRVRTQLQFIF